MEDNMNINNIGHDNGSDADEINVIELFDENGESIKFEHLDTIGMNGKRYVVITPIVEEMPDNEEIESDVYIMVIVNNEDGEEMLEMIEDEQEIASVFEVFKTRTKDDYEFI